MSSSGMKPQNVNTIPNLTMCKSPKISRCKNPKCAMLNAETRRATQLELTKCEERIQGRREVVLLPQRRGEVRHSSCQYKPVPPVWPSRLTSRRGDKPPVGYR